MIFELKLTRFEKAFLNFKIYNFLFVHKQLFKIDFNFSNSSRLKLARFEESFLNFKMYNFLNPVLP